MMKTQKREHYEKYETLAQQFERFDLPMLVPVSRERILQALAAGDEHLNTIPLKIWDRAAAIEYKTGVDSPWWVKTDRCPTCGQVRPGATVKRVVDPLWAAFKHETKNGWAYYSLAERVCLLKHVAKYWMAQATPPDDVETTD